MTPPFKAYRTASGRTVEQTLKQYGDKAAAALGKQLYREANGIMSASGPLVPVDTNALRSSGYVQPPEQEGSHISVSFGYGGPAAKINPKTGQSTDAYALFVHENLEAFHKVGSAKYLEMPFDQARTGMGKRIAEGLRADLAGAAAPNFVYGGISEMGDPEA